MLFTSNQYVESVQIITVSENLHGQVYHFVALGCIKVIICCYEDVQAIPCDAVTKYEQLDSTLKGGIGKVV